MDDSSPSRRVRLSIAGMITGFVMILGGLAWSVTAKPEAVWSLEQAAEFQAAGEALHAARSQPESANSDGQSALHDAQQRFDRIEAELVAAQTRRERIGQWLVRLGLAAMVLFGLGYLSVRRE